MGKTRLGETKSSIGKAHTRRASRHAIHENIVLYVVPKAQQM